MPDPTGAGGPCSVCGGSGWWCREDAEIPMRRVKPCDKVAETCPRCSHFAGYDVRCSMRCFACNGTGRSRYSPQEAPNG